MQRIVKDERGLSFIEVLSVLTICGVVFALVSGLLLSISKTTSIQAEKIEMQQTANSILAQVERISNISGIYEQAGYLGEFVGSSGTNAWNDAHIVKLLQEDGTGEWLETSRIGPGGNRIAITDITDTLNQSKEIFQMKNSETKIKILQQKNENELTKTIYTTPNYRDTFSIQSTVMVLFYNEKIDFSDYYDEITGFWNYNEIKELPNVLYSRESVFCYRDDAKSKGEVPGNGRW